MKWRISDYVQDRLVGFRLYDGPDCSEGATDITDFLSDYTASGIIFDSLGLQPDSNTPYDSTAQGYRDFRLFLGISNLTDSDFANTVAPDLFKYEIRNNQSFAIINFCVRFQLFMDDFDDPNSVEVNFQETIVEVYIDLTDGFEIDSIDVAAKDRLIRTENIQCEIEAYYCDPDSYEPIDITNRIL